VLDQQPAVNARAQCRQAQEILTIQTIQHAHVGQPRATLSTRTAVLVLLVVVCIQYLTCVISTSRSSSRIEYSYPPVTLARGGVVFIRVGSCNPVRSGVRRTGGYELVLMIGTRETGHQLYIYLHIFYFKS
jgi:hypothetical protein